MKVRTSLALIICSLGFIFYSATLPNVKDASLVKGYLDLSDWDFESSGNIFLNGEWGFAWKDFLPPVSSGETEISEYITPDIKWGGNSSNKDRHKSFGYATYRAYLTLPDSDALMALHIPNIGEAYTIYINEKEVLKSGVPGKSIETSVPFSRPRTAFFIPDSKDIVITIHVSNYNMARGGIKAPLIFGNYENITSYTEKWQVLVIFLVNFLFITGIYYSFVYFIGNRKITTLNLAAFCFMLTIWLLITSHVPILSIIDHLSWNVQLRIEYISMYLAMFFILNYLFSYLEYSQKSWIVLSFTIIISLFIIISIFLKPLIFTTFLLGGQFVFVFYMAFALIRFAQLVKKDYSRYLLSFLSVFILFAAFINDIINLHTQLETIILFPIGMTLFIFVQAIEIINRAYKNNRTITKQRNELLESKNRLERSRFGTIIGLAKLAEYRDEDTGLHLERIKEYCKILAEQLAKTARYADYITDKYIDDLYQSSVLHDIGKVAIPDSILLKKGKLTPEEFDVMKEHTVIAGKTLLKIESEMDDTTLLSMGKEIAFHHHEKWDGSGYPYGLKGDDIPLSARITTLSDVYDALTSERPYKKAFTHEKAKEIILEGKGCHFDPDVVNAFLEREEDFKLIRASFIDEPSNGD